MFNVCTCFLETHIEQIWVQTDMGAPVVLFILYSTQHLQLLLLYYRLFETHQLNVQDTL